MCKEQCVSAMDRHIPCHASWLECFKIAMTASVYFEFISGHARGLWQLVAQLYSWETNCRDWGLGGMVSGSGLRAGCIKSSSCGRGDLENHGSGASTALQKAWRTDLLYGQNSSCSIHVPFVTLKRETLSHLEAIPLKLCMLCLSTLSVKPRNHKFGYFKVSNTEE